MKGPKAWKQNNSFQFCQKMGRPSKKKNTKFDRKLWADIAEDPSIKEKNNGLPAMGQFFLKPKYRVRKNQH